MYSFFSTCYIYLWTVLLVNNHQKVIFYLLMLYSTVAEGLYRTTLLKMLYKVCLIEKLRKESNTYLQPSDLCSNFDPRVIFIKKLNFLWYKLLSIMCIMKFTTYSKLHNIFIQTLCHTSLILRVLYEFKNSRLKCSKWFKWNI